MNEYVRLDVSDEIATVTLDHPDVRNALTREVGNGLIEAMEAVEDSDARCVVVTGSEGIFCAGGDVKAMLNGLESDVSARERVERIVEQTAAAVKAVATCDLPTIAAIEGPAYGAGGCLAVACDVQLASAGAKISFGFRQVGLSIDAGASYLLPRLVGENVAKELVFTGELIDAQRAKEVGLFNHVYEPEAFDDRVDEFAERVASGPTLALANSKRLLEQGMDSTLDEAIRNEATTQLVALESDDHAEGVAAFTEEREAEFRGE